MNPDKGRIEESLPIPLEKLTQPAILLLLSQEECHGYDLIQKMSEANFLEGVPDTATVYRSLRRMEQDGLLASYWKHGESGPARRQYQLTDKGLIMLDGWIKRLEKRKAQIDLFINYHRRNNQ